MNDIIINVDEALSRFGGNDSIYKMLLKKFLVNPYYDELNTAITGGDMIAAQHAAHTLKGTAGNLSLSALFESATQLDIRLKESADYTLEYNKLGEIYQQTMAEIANYTN